MKLRGKRVVITGASSGIGLEILKQLLAYDCRVVACARQVEKLKDLQDSPLANGRLYLKRCDVSDKDELDELFRYSLGKLGHIDLFIANAGFAYYEVLGEPDWEHTEKIFETNVFGMIYCAERMKQLRGKKPYNFVVTASAMGLLSLPGYALYSGTKAAVRGFADAYRYELGDRQHFQVIYPVATRTEFFNRAGDSTPVPWPTQTPQTVARRVIAGIERDKNHIFPSRTFYVTSLADRICPLILKSYVVINNYSFKKWLKKSRK